MTPGWSIADVCFSAAEPVHPRPPSAPSPPLAPLPAAAAAEAGQGVRMVALDDVGGVAESLLRGQVPGRVVVRVSE